MLRIVKNISNLNKVNNTLFNTVNKMLIRNIKPVIPKLVTDNLPK
jgi:hypothetical protein